MQVDEELVIDDDDLLARHVIEKSYIRSSNNSVKPKAFQPARDNCTSSFKISGLSKEKITIIGEDNVAKPRGKRLLGWVKFTAGTVIKSGLTLDPNNVPERHVDITGWPESKEERMSIQLELAASSEFVTC